MSSKAKQCLKTSILKQESSNSEVIQKIDQLLNRLSTVPETPTNSGESTSRIQTCSSKAINALDQDSNDYNRISAPDLALEERELGFVSFNANNVYEWNIDGKIEYNIVSMLQHMAMVGTAYQVTHETSEEAIANVNDQNEPIIGDDGEPNPDAVNTLIFTITSQFIDGTRTPFLLGSIPKKTVNNLCGRKNS
ncbi:uncharacterized protein DS421_6g186530 [Arachis hypogaea]|nr:uncharacterized protein DS421_6g186530 [Arachis hypogaea]